MQSLDWIIFVSYILFVFLIGIWVSKKAKTGLDSYFGAGRSIPWWWLGISIIATTFAADTPLAITGITANTGISGNWFWWSWAATYITVAIFFSKRWRKSGVLTDVELIELRYDGPQAAALRGFKAFFFGIILNCFILGWVVTAAVKIAGPFIDWNNIIGVNAFQTLEGIYPAFLLFKGDFNATLTILALLLLVTIYSSLGGIRGVILTDLVQFAIAMVTAVVFAIYAVKAVGGVGEMMSSIKSIYGAEKARSLTQFVPSFDNKLLPFQVFLVYILVQWWVRYDSDGTGYIAQRINTAKTHQDAQKGSLLFAIAFVALRTWPWVLVALASLVLFPLDNPTVNFVAEGNLVGADREIAYPILMKLLLPVGMLGLAFTSLMAAFMSTVDTHLNWGASYLVNDIYKRFVNPAATSEQLIKLSRWLVVLITVIAILVSSQMDSIANAWKFFINVASGLGIAHIIRWFWWRANAYTEIAAMAAALIGTIAMVLLKPATAGPHFETYALVYISLFSLIAAVFVTLITPAVGQAHLNAFIGKTQPVGFWQGKSTGEASAEKFSRQLIMWLLGLTVSFGGLFAVGYLVLQQFGKGILATIISISSYLALQYMFKQETNED